MIQFVYEQDETISTLVARMIPGMKRGFGACKTIGVLDEHDRFLAGIVFHGWTPENGTIVVSGAAFNPRWMSRGVLARIGQFAFEECGCQMVLMQIPADNERLLRQLAVIGFSFVNVPRFFGHGRDGVIATLTDDDWQASRFNRKYASTKLEEAA